MGLLALLKGDRIYVDANIWIYALEGFSDYKNSLIALSEAVAAGKLALVTSELSLSEVLVRPIKKGDILGQEVYKKAIKTTDVLTVVPVDRNILIQAAEIRASTKLKLPDAIHAASALSDGCTTFLTNDKQFRTVPALHTCLLSQISLNSNES